MRSPLRRTSAAVLCALLLGSCTGLPKDPDDTLDTVRQQAVLRVGASPATGRVSVEENEVGGIEARLVSDLAATLGARVDWQTGGESELVAAMEQGELDVLIAGLAADSPWVDRVSLTRPYDETVESDGVVSHVLAVPLGENAMLVELERFLDKSGHD